MCVYLLFFIYFFPAPASPDEKERVGQTEKGGQRAMAERAKEDGELIGIKAALEVGHVQPHAESDIVCTWGLG